MAAKFIREYQEFFDRYGGMRVKLIFIYRMFYSGLVVFHCFCETKDQYWMNLGKGTISQTETWMKKCKWNFKNKILLLNAEYQFSIDHFDKTTEEYGRKRHSLHNNQ